MVRARQPRPWLLVLRSCPVHRCLGLAAPWLVNVILAGVPGTSAGAAGGVLTTINQIGNPTGVALLGTLFFTTLAGSFTHGHASLNSYSAAFGSLLPWQGGLYLLAALLMLALPKKTAAHQHRDLTRGRRKDPGIFLREGFPSPGSVGGPLRSAWARSVVCGDAAELGEGLLQSLRQRGVVVGVDPVFERDLEYGHACLRGQAGGGVADAACAQRVGQRCGKGGELGELALVEFGVGSDQLLAHAHERAELFEEGTGCLERAGDRVQWPCTELRVPDAAHQPVLQLARAGEQHFALVGVVPEERPFGEPGTLGNVRNGGGVVAAFAVQLDRRLCQPSARVGLPPAHDRSLPTSMAGTDVSLYRR